MSQSSRARSLGVKQDTDADTLKLKGSGRRGRARRVNTETADSEEVDAAAAFRAAVQRDLANRTTPMAG